MQVFIVMKGERGEGGHIAAVFAKEEAAKVYFTKEFLKLKRKWTEVYKTNPDYIADRTERFGDYACVACDTISIVAAEVVGTTP